MIDELPVDGPVDGGAALRQPREPAGVPRAPIETLEVGSIGTHHALDLARKHDGARVLLASTSEVYGDPLVHPQPESYWGNVNPVGPRSVYDEAKRFAEAITMAYHREYGVDTKIVRIFNTYGPLLRPATAGSSRTSSRRRSTGARSRSTATASRPVRSATSTTRSRGSSRCSSPTTSGR